MKSKYLLIAFIVLAVMGISGCGDGSNLLNPQLKIVIKEIESKYYGKTANLDLFQTSVTRKAYGTATINNSGQVTFALLEHDTDEPLTGGLGNLTSLTYTTAIFRIYDDNSLLSVPIYAAGKAPLVITHETTTIPIKEFSVDIEAPTPP